MYARSLCEDEEDGPIGPSPLEKITATGDPVDIKSDITKIKSTVSKIQASPAYQVGMRLGLAAWRVLPRLPEGRFRALCLNLESS